MNDQPIKVLLVEDNPADARLIREMLADVESTRFTVESTDRLSTALEQQAAIGFDVILLDLVLPDSEGLDTFAKARAGATQVPIIMLTGLDDESLAVEAVREGAQDYLVKGRVDSDLLGRAIRYSIERKRTEEELKKHRDHLQELVEQRTAELAAINEQLRRRNEELATLNAIGGAMAGSLDLDAIINQALDKVLEVMTAATGGIGWLDVAKGELTPAASRGLGDEHLQDLLSLVVGEGVAPGETCAQEPVFIENLTQHAGAAAIKGTLEETGLQSLVAVTLEVRERLWGILAIASGDVSSFTEDDARLLSSIGSQIGMAAKNASLYQEARQLVLQMEALRQTSLDITRQLDLSQLLSSIARTAQEAIPGADRAVIHLVDKQSQLLTPRASSAPQSDPAIPAIAARSEGIAELVQQGRTSIYIPDTQDDPRYLDLGSGLPSLLIAPLMIGPKIVGTLSVESARTDAFGEDDDRMLTMLASEAAIAIENARLYERLRESEERYRTYVETVPDAIWETDAEGRFTYCSPQIEHLSGYAPQDFLGHTPYEFWVHADDVDEVRKLSQQMVEVRREAFTVRHRALHKQGALLHVELSIRPVWDGNGGVAKYRGVTRDVSDQTRLQAQLTQNEKMAALGRLGASVAHEINNPLQSVLGCLMLIREELDEGRRDDELTRFLDVAEGEIHRISAIVKRMYEFYRPAHEALRATSIHAVLESLLDLVAKQLQHSRVTVEREWAVDLPLIQANSDHLKQVFLNLVLNAVDAMPSGGTLRIRTAADEIRSAGHDRPAPAVRVEVSDTGNGIPPEVMPHVFEPFVTTKEHGSGLGLSISYGIVGSHNGQITVTSRAGKGATFSILLPVEQPGDNDSADPDR